MFLYASIAVFLSLLFFFGVCYGAHISLFKSSIFFDWNLLSFTSQFAYSLLLFTKMSKNACVKNSMSSTPNAGANIQHPESAFLLSVTFLSFLDNKLQ